MGPKYFSLLRSAVRLCVSCEKLVAISLFESLLKNTAGYGGRMRYYCTAGWVNNK